MHEFGLMPCRHLRPSPGRYNAVFILIQSGGRDDEDGKNEANRQNIETLLGLVWCIGV